MGGKKQKHVEGRFYGRSYFAQEIRWGTKKKEKLPEAKAANHIQTFLKHSKRKKKKLSHPTTPPFLRSKPPVVF